MMHVDSTVDSATNLFWETIPKIGWASLEEPP
jgi:hypothetical protein